MSDSEGSSQRHDDAENEYIDSDDVGAMFTPPGTPSYFINSPSSRLPPRVGSSNSLFGEHIMSSTRRSMEEDEQTTTPPSYMNTPMTLSPPLLKQETPPIFQTGDESVHSHHSIKSRGRPPLAPHPQFTLAQIRQASNATSTSSNHHKREKSTGDSSFLSALTDTSDSDGELPFRIVERKPHRRHRTRSVSWDQTCEGSPVLEAQLHPPDILQPILLDDSPPLQKVSGGRKQIVDSLGLLAASQPIQPAPPKAMQFQNFTLADILSPIETEAETAILNAIEDHQQKQLSAREMMLPSVPDDAAHSFQESMGNETLSIEGSDPVAEADEKKDNYSVPDNCSVAKKFLRGDSVSMHTPLGITKATIAETKPSLSQRRRKNSDVGSKASTKFSKPGHHRVQSRHTIASRSDQASLESTLQDLTTVMREIHSASDEPSKVTEPSSVRRRLPSHDIGSPGAALDDEPVNNEDTFVHNANLLFRQQLSANTQNQQYQPLLEVPTKIPPVDPDAQRKPNINLDLSAGPYLNDIPERINALSQHDVEVEIDIEAGENALPGKEKLDDNPQRCWCKIVMPLKKCAETISDTVKSAMNFPNTMKQAIFVTRENFGVLNTCWKSRAASIKLFARLSFLYIFIPTLGISFLLFHGLGNPSMAVGCVAKQTDKDSCPSVSWFLNFLIVRQFIAFSLGLGTELFVVDFLALKTSFFLRLIGPSATLMIVQSKGWPFQLSVWAFYSFILNSGVNYFARHWLFFQSGLDIFNENNPAGDIPNSWWNYRALEVALIFGVVVGIKRFLVGLYLGRRTYAIYGNQLAKVIHQMIIISQVAALGREFERLLQDPNFSDITPRLRQTGIFDWNWGGFNDTGLDEEDDQNDDERAKSPHHRLCSNQTGGIKSGASPENLNDRRNQINGMLNESEKMKIVQLLEAWEEPERDPGRPQKISISAILQFRQSLAFMDLSFPFATAFGLADTREHCIESSQGVYRRLLLEDSLKSTGVLDFSTISVLAKADSDGLDVDEIDPAKMKDLIRLFRPSRDGKLTMLEFVKSVDTVYKSLRLLRASISNSSQIGHATEIMINVVFYFFVFCIILASFKVNPLAFFLSLSSVIIAFAFMIGAASAKYFEGILFILVRQPYDIGDRIAISDPNVDTSADGSAGWFVEKVDLYTTTVRYANTNEVATLANGSLAISRIINAARSPKACVYLNLKFGVDVPYAKVQLFRKTVEAFVKARPREWMAMGGIRAARVESDLGFIEYVISCQHREGWQNVLPILQSKADLFSYCLEVQKQLGMRYNAPSLPVDLRIAQLNVPGPGGANLSVVGDGIGVNRATEPRHQVNTSSVPEGVKALADLFPFREKSR